jgi:hypothetical protein
VTLCVFTQRIRQNFPMPDFKTKFSKEASFARAISMLRIQQILSDSLPVNNCNVGVGSFIGLMLAGEVTAMPFTGQCYYSINIATL